MKHHQQYKVSLEVKTKEGHNMTTSPPKKRKACFFQIKTTFLQDHSSIKTTCFQDCSSLKDHFCIKSLLTRQSIIQEQHPSPITREAAKDILLLKTFQDSFDTIANMSGYYIMCVNLNVKPVQHAYHKVPIESRGKTKLQEMADLGVTTQET